MNAHTPGVQCHRICCTFDRERANRAPGRRSLTPLYSPTGEVGTGASGGGDPASTEATLWVNRSVDCPEAPAQANFPLYSPAAATRDAAVGGLYSPAVTTRDVTAGGSTTEKERSAGYPTGHGVRQGLADAVAVQLPSHLSATATAGEAVPVDASSAYTSGADGSEPPSRWRAPTSSVCHGDTVPEPVGRLGDVVTLDALRRSGGVS